jgi:vacuolar-type H+-ATPase subunit I/STV1
MDKKDVVHIWMYVDDVRHTFIPLSSTWKGPSFPTKHAYILNFLPFINLYSSKVITLRVFFNFLHTLSYAFYNCPTIGMCENLIIFLEMYP